MQSQFEAIFGNWKPFKNDQKCFLFQLKSSFLSQDIKVFALIFWSRIKKAWLKRLRSISNFMMSQPGQQTVLIHILPNISRCLILFLVFPCNNFLFCAFVTMIHWTSTEVLLNLVAPLDSAVPSLDFEQINVFWTSDFDSVSIVFDSLSVSRSFPELYFLHSI